MNVIKQTYVSLAWFDHSVVCWSPPCTEHNLLGEINHNGNLGSINCSEAAKDGSRNLFLNQLRRYYYLKVRTSGKVLEHRSMLKTSRFKYLLLYISCILLTIAVSTGGVAVILHIPIVFATSMTVTAILPVLTISTVLFVCSTPCKLDVFKSCLTDVRENSDLYSVLATFLVLCKYKYTHNFFKGFKIPATLWS